MGQDLHRLDDGHAGRRRAPPRIGLTLIANLALALACALALAAAFPCALGGIVSTADGRANTGPSHDA